MPTQVFFSDTRHQKRSLASLNEYFGNAEAGKKIKLGNEMELLEVPFNKFGKEYNLMLVFANTIIFDPVSFGLTLAIWSGLILLFARISNVINSFNLE